MKFFICLTLLSFLQCSVFAEETNSQDKSPYIELILCPSTDDPWGCAREQTSRLLDEWSSDLKFQWQDLKGAADKELNATLVSRGFSSVEHIKEKPSTIFTKLEIGTNYLSKFAQETADDFVGRDNNLSIETDPGIITSNTADDDDDNNNDDEYENQEKFGSSFGAGGGGSEVGTVGSSSGLSSSNFGNLLKKKPFGSNGLQAIINRDPFQINGFEHILDGNDKRKKHGLKKPLNYGRSNGVTRGKKKKKKALVKLMFLATILKGKIELLLKILSAHLQIKFFAIALVGLIINIARFWVDLKRGGTPQKVIYYEHAHHQHHYEDQGNEDWGDQGSSVPASGGYWKRSLPTGGGSSINTGSSTNNNGANNIDLTYSSSQHDPHYLPYRHQIPSTHY